MNDTALVEVGQRGGDAPEYHDMSLKWQRMVAITVGEQARSDRELHREVGPVVEPPHSLNFTMLGWFSRPRMAISRWKRSRMLGLSSTERSRIGSWNPVRPSSRLRG